MASISHKSARFESPSSPRSSGQWRRILQDIKLLYFRSQYKQCATRSMEVLRTAAEPPSKIHPVHKTYLYYYCAISYEGMGRAAHQYSSTKLTFLHSALDCFVTCCAVLPDCLSVPDIPDGGSPSTVVEFTSPSETHDPASSSPASSFDTMITDILDREPDSLVEDDPFLDTPCKFPSHQLGNPVLIPSPLKIRKSFEDLNQNAHPLHHQHQENVTPETPARRTRRPPPLPIKIVPFGTTSKESSTVPPLSIHKHRSQHGSGSSMTSSHIMAINRYNNSIRFLRTQINSSITSLHALIDDVRQVQQSRRASKNIRRSGSFWSFSPIMEEGEENLNSGPGLDRASASMSMSGSTKETHAQRIARLRASGWKTVGLRSPSSRWKGAEYYRQYCSAVLDELYLDP
ncbi:hypothetical protein EYZ11_008431 [Aspergillus tanneri]|uniref:Uncharacterized protein n=1 Tax=Aspergillus tanneri TaxID=1220188 RepID=A0A4S3JAX5_9EURO|nr:uncharacterized protein ATNIH1004_008310 [Aspergillus tanneri]KAA8644112.1 hypothetical protein ATNIH1004_008310 [Aspergillus tanneri]THC92105.1 hypothetical protein EYZ11_008431 [Aspergillus tanneri]